MAMAGGEGPNKLSVAPRKIGAGNLGPSPRANHAAEPQGPFVWA